VVYGFFSTTVEAINMLTELLRLDAEDSDLGNQSAFRKRKLEKITLVVPEFFFMIYYCRSDMHGHDLF